MTANREYKDSVFTMLFKSKEKLIVLYNALTGNSFPYDTPVEIATLTNVLFNSWRNDIAFVINGRLVVLIEHQSTVNENMPLRFFIYIARVYEKLISNASIYSTKLIKIPKPEFIVLYNGIAPYPAEKRLKLSDSFMEDTGVTTAVTPSAASLELEVRVININEGNNERILSRSEELSGYTRLVSRINMHRRTSMDLTESVSKAVSECVAEGILSEFLIKHGSEVINMMTLIYDADMEKQVIREEGKAEGKAEGIEIGQQNLTLKLLQAGVDIEVIAKALGVPKTKVLKQETV